MVTPPTWERRSPYHPRKTFCSVCCRTEDSMSDSPRGAKRKRQQRRHVPPKNPRKDGAILKSAAGAGLRVPLFPAAGTKRRHSDSTVPASDSCDPFVLFLKPTM